MSKNKNIIDFDEMIASVFDESDLNTAERDTTLSSRVYSIALKQLSSISPPLSEAELQSQMAELEQAIQRAEARYQYANERDKELEPEVPEAPNPESNSDNADTELEAENESTISPPHMNQANDRSRKTWLFSIAGIALLSVVAFGFSHKWDDELTLFKDLLEWKAEMLNEPKELFPSMTEANEWCLGYIEMHENTPENLFKSKYNSWERYVLNDIKIKVFNDLVDGWDPDREPSVVEKRCTWVLTTVERNKTVEEVRQYREKVILEETIPKVLKRLGEFKPEISCHLDLSSVPYSRKSVLFDNEVPAVLNWEKNEFGKFLACIQKERTGQQKKAYQFIVAVFDEDIEGVNLKSVIAKRNVAIDIDAFDKPLGLLQKEIDIVASQVYAQNKTKWNSYTINTLKPKLKEGRSIDRELAYKAYKAEEEKRLDELAYQESMKRSLRMAQEDDQLSMFARGVRSAADKYIREPQQRKDAEAARNLTLWAEANQVIRNDNLFDGTKEPYKNSARGLSNPSVTSCYPPMGSFCPNLYNKKTKRHDIDNTACKTKSKQSIDDNVRKMSPECKDRMKKELARDRTKAGTGGKHILK